jgi:hypothetical protein
MTDYYQKYLKYKKKYLELKNQDGGLMYAYSNLSSSSGYDSSGYGSSGYGYGPIQLSEDYNRSIEFIKSTVLGKNRYNYKYLVPFRIKVQYDNKPKVYLNIINYLIYGYYESDYGGANMEAINKLKISITMGITYNVQYYFSFEKDIPAFMSEFNTFKQQCEAGKPLFNFVNNYYEKFYNYLNGFAATIKSNSEYTYFNYLLFPPNLLELNLVKIFEAEKDTGPRSPFNDYMRAVSTIPNYLEVYNHIIKNQALLSKFNQELQKYYNAKCKEKNKLSYLLKCRKKV